MPIVALLLACTASPPTREPAPPLLDDGWITAVARTPEAFTSAIAAEKEGWVALHRNDWPAAVAAGGEPAARASAELARLHGVLASASELAWLTLGEKWGTVGGPPSDSAFALFAWGAAVDAGNGEATARWQAATAGSTAPAARARASASAPLLADVDDALAPRVALHRRQRLTPGPLSPAELASLAEPLLTEASGSAPRELWDPWLHRSLSASWAAAAAGSEGMGARLFSDQLGPADVPVDAALSRLGLAIPGGVDDAEACRELARQLDTVLDPWQVQLAAASADDGRALLHDLQLVPATRSRVLVTLAVSALVDNHPQCALAYGEMARDHASGRAITAINSPTLFAVLAQANLATGHTREALDALEVLTQAYPELHGLDETLGDLAVLEGIHRAGDSREN